MKKAVILIVLAVAMASAYGQSTPEAIIGQSPTLPSSRDLAERNTEAFRAEIARLQQKCNHLVKVNEVSVSQVDVAKIESEMGARVNCFADATNDDELKPHFYLYF